MDKYRQVTSTIIAEMKERGYSNRSINNHSKIYETLNSHLELMEMAYSPDLGKAMLEEGSIDHFGIKGDFVRAAAIAKLNDVWLNGTLKNAAVSPRKPYSSIRLCAAFEASVSGFLEHCREDCGFSESQIENAVRRCRLFLKCMQSWDRKSLTEITYDDIRNYHNELFHLKHISRVIEESTLHQFLKYLYENGKAGIGKYLYMYVLEKGGNAELDTLPEAERKRIEEIRQESLAFPADEFLAAGSDLIQIHLEEGYSPAYMKAFERTVLYLYLFLDLNGLGFHAEIADIWVGSTAARSILHGSSLEMARRFLNVFRDFSADGGVNLCKVYHKGISGLRELPEWCRVPLENFALHRSRQKLDDSTVKNDIYSILRFCRYLLDRGLSSYGEIDGQLVMDFNLEDTHVSPEGKNSCNARIRRFLRYLYRDGIITKDNLHLALGSAASPVETIVRTLEPDEVDTIRGYMKKASSPIEIRDCAMMLLGTDMGMRGSDIVSLSLADIDWKNQCIRFRQSKTGADTWLAMPTGVGNAIYRYLKDARPRDTKSDSVFVSTRAPYGGITRSVCYSTLCRVLPERDVPGSGFHVTRKSFSTNRLRSGVSPSGIADALGHSGTDNLRPYLSLDVRNMSKCPLSLVYLGIPVEGGRR